MKLYSAGWSTTAVFIGLIFPGFYSHELAAQQLGVAPIPAKPVALNRLLTEAEQNNPQIQAARSGYRAARNVPRSVGALPDRHIEVQTFSVGSPKPFAGYTNSDFSYIGFGASQDIPYPGKRRLRSEAALQEAEARGAGVEWTRRNVLQQIKVAYFQLSYLQQADSVLKRGPAITEYD